MLNIISYQRNKKWKPNQDTTVHLLAKIKGLIIPNAGEEAERYSVGGNAKWYSALENSLAVSYKVKYLLKFLLSDIYPVKVNIYVYTKPLTNVYRSFIHNSLKLKPMSINHRMEKHIWYIYTIEYTQAATWTNLKSSILGERSRTP